MRDIFADLYNKVMSFFATPVQHDPTKGVAMNRLKTVLMQDRVGFSERAMQMLKEELVSTISKYMEIDEEKFDLEINADDNSTILNLSIPVTRAKTDDEIDEAIKEQAVKTQAKAQEIVQELEELIKERAAALAQGADVAADDEAQNEQPQDQSSEDEAQDSEKTPENADTVEDTDNEEAPLEAADAAQGKNKKAKIKED